MSTQEKKKEERCVTDDSEEEGSVVRAVCVGQDTLVVRGLTPTHVPNQQ